MPWLSGGGPNYLLCLALSLWVQQGWEQHPVLWHRQGKGSSLLTATTYNQAQAWCQGAYWRPSAPPFLARLSPPSHQHKTPIFLCCSQQHPPYSRALPSLQLPFPCRSSLWHQAMSCPSFISRSPGDTCLS